MWFLRRRSRSMEEADTALEQATIAKEEIEARGPEVTKLSQSFRDMRQRNHFVERMQGIIERNEGTA